MKERVASRPGLYTLPDAAHIPALCGTACTSCGTAFFPPQRYGCERCGAGPERIERRPLAGTGTLRSFATVHRALRPEPAAPFVIGTVRLDAGPELEAVLACGDESELAFGMPVRATLVPVGVDAEGREIVDCRFAPAAER